MLGANLRGCNLKGAICIPPAEFLPIEGPPTASTMGAPVKELVVAKLAVAKGTLPRGISTRESAKSRNRSYSKPQHAPRVPTRAPLIRLGRSPTSPAIDVKGPR